MKLCTLLISMIVAQQAHALRNPDLTGDDAGAAAVYTMDENYAQGATTKVNADTSGVGTALDLTAHNEGNFPPADGAPPLLINAFSGQTYSTEDNVSINATGALSINRKPNRTNGMADQGYQSAQLHRTYLVSNGPATKLNQCGTTGITVQAFIRAHFPFNGQRNKGNTIVALSNSSGQSTIQTPNFAILQGGQNNSENIIVRVRNSAGGAADVMSVVNRFSSVREAESAGQLTEVIATMEASGKVSVYLNRVPSTTTVVNPGFLQDAVLVVGNELVPLSMKLDKDGNLTTNPNIDEQSNWSGEIHHMAIYCKGFSIYEILGDAVPGQLEYPAFQPQNTPITEARRFAKRMYERLTGVITPIDNPVLGQMETLVAAGKKADAAKIVTGDIATNIKPVPDFLNTTVKHMALKISNREETIRVPLNDMAAMYIGVTRDESDARELMYGDFYYRADTTKAAVPHNLAADFLKTNNELETLDNGQWDIGRALKRVEGQSLAIDSQGNTIPHPDPSGVLTSNAFMKAHAIMGTQRRVIQYTLMEFLCTPIAEAADTSASSSRIGRDVDRKPGGDPNKFEMSCKGCHTIMDGFRGAFARFDIGTVESGKMIVKHTESGGTGMYGFTKTGNDREADENNIVRKLNHNENVALNYGQPLTDATFINNAIGIKNKNLFGWRGEFAKGGTGAGQFGHLIGESKRYPQCLARKVYEQICLPPKGYNYQEISPVLNNIATGFESNGYKIKYLFQQIIANPVCLK